MTKRIIVVGAGILGSTIAFNLSEQGAEVTILDVTEGGGLATRTSFAWINASWGNTERYFRFRTASMREWRNLAARLPDLSLNWCGSICWDLPDDQLNQFADEHVSWGYRLAWASEAEIKRLEPNLRTPPTKALLAPEEGVVEPMVAARTLLAAAQARGATFIPHANAKTVVTKNSRVCGVSTETDEFLADEIVLAAGAGTVHLAHTAGWNLPLATPPGLIVHSVPGPRLIDRLLIAPELHVRQTAEGRLVAGSDFGGSDPGERPDETARELFAKVQNFVAGAESLMLDFHTVGYRPTPKDGLPVIGRPSGIEGLYVTVMHSGITNAAGVGLYATQEILSGERSELLTPFSPDRFAA
jgi:glycine/D-amino acid oxidase-like deaminating enzyme